MIAVLLWSSAFAGSRYALQHYSPGSLMLLRFILASATLVTIGAIKKIRLPKKKDLPFFLMGGFVGIFLYMFFFNLGAVTVVAGVGSFIIASTPVYTIILSRLLLKEIVKPICWIGVAVSFCGLVVVMLSQTTGFNLNIGLLLMLGSAISSSAHMIIQRNLFKTYTALEATTYSVLVATVFMLVFIPNVIRELPDATLQTNLVVAFMGIFPAALGYLLWGYALSISEKTTNVAVFLYLIPFMASLLAFFWLGETFSLMTLIGGIVIIGGMALTNAKVKE